MKAIRVQLKHRRNNKDYSLYLRWWDVVNKKYEHEFLPIRVKDWPPKTQEDKERKHEAEKLRNRKESDMLSSFLGTVPPSRKKTTFLEYFIELRKNKGWDNVIVHLKQFPRANTLLYQVNDDFVKDLKDFLLNRPKVSQNTANFYFSKVKACLHAAEGKIINMLDWKEIGKIKILPKPIEALTQIEFELLAKTPLKNRETQRSFLFSCLTGLRYSDVKKLTFAEIDFSKMEINLVQKKTGDIVKIPLLQTAKELALENIPAGTMPHPSMLVFPKLGTPQRVNTDLKAWNKLVKPSMHYHLSRTTFASNIYEATEDLYAVSKLLGHQDVGVTQKYLRVSGRKLKNVVHVALGNFNIK